MRKVILTQNNNIVLFTPAHHGYGSVLKANDYVELAVVYKDPFHQPITRRRLIWRIVEGNAILRQPTTLTDGNGQGTNQVKVQLDDPQIQVTVRFAVWPQDEPEDVLDFECMFGAAAPSVTRGDVLQTVFPRNDTTGKTSLFPSGNSVSTGVIFHFLYADNTGNLIPNKTLDYKLQGDRYNNDAITNQNNGFLYTSRPDPFKYGSLAETLALDISVGGLTAHSSLVVTNLKNPTMQVNNFWPPANSVLQQGKTYPLRALFTGGNGTLLPGTIRWSLAGSSIGSSFVTISPETCPIDNTTGIAESSITIGTVPYGRSNTVNLSVSLVGSTEYNDLAFDTPSFTIDVERIASIAPSPNSIIKSGGDTPFAVVLQPMDGSPISNARILWSTNFGGSERIYFTNQISFTNGLGQATNTLHNEAIAQGKKIDFTVTITPPLGEPFTALYTIVTNTVTQVIPSPTSTGPFNIGSPLTIQVSLRDPLGAFVFGKTILGTTTFGTFQSGSQHNTQTTDNNGLATFQLTANTAGTASLQFCEGIEGYNIPTCFSLTFGQPEITINPPANKDMRYDSWVTVSASLKNASGQPVTGVKTTWGCTNGVELENVYGSITDVNGLSTNRIRFQTLNGYPNPAITTLLSVRTPDGTTSNSQELTFTSSSLFNQLQLVAPADGSQILTDQPTLVTIQLTNQFGQPLTNYRIAWEEPSDEAIVLDYDPITDTNGTATARVKGTITGLAQFDATAQLAVATCDFTYDFIEVALPDYSVLIDSIYAHNPPRGTPVDPFDNSQVVTFTFRYLTNNVPQGSRDVIWYFNPRTPELYFFNEQNATLSVNPTGNIVTKTDNNGLTVLKIGSTTRFLGTIFVVPKDDPNASAMEYSIAIATFDNGDYDLDLMPVIYSPNPIDIPDKFTTANAGFDVNIQQLQNTGNTSHVVFWISSGAPGTTPQENIKIVTANKAEQGITVPYSYVCPDPFRSGCNSFSYMVVQPNTSSSILARPVTPVVQGNPMSNHPDYNNTNRPLPNPHLHNYANVVNGNSIAKGLDVYIPYSKSWIAGDIINLNLYLNGEDDMGKLIGNTVGQPKTITAAQISSKTDIIISFQQDQLIGYKFGTLEADYYIGQTWSQILENVTLDTLAWS